MEPISSSSSPDFSNVESSSSSTAPSPGPTCTEAWDSVGYETADFADSVRDFLSGDASARGIWDATKDLAQSGVDALDTCFPEERFKQEPQFVFPTPVYY